MLLNEVTVTLVNSESEKGHAAITHKLQPNAESIKETLLVLLDLGAL